MNMVDCTYLLKGHCLCPEKQKPGYVAVPCDQCIERGGQPGNAIDVHDSFLISIRT